MSHCSPLDWCTVAMVTAWFVNKVEPIASQAGSGERQCKSQRPIWRNYVTPANTNRQQKGRKNAYPPYGFMTAGTQSSAGFFTSSISGPNWSLTKTEFTRANAGSLRSFTR